MLQKRKKIVSAACHRATQRSVSPSDGTVDYAGVPVIDFAGVHTPEGRLELAPKVRDAMRNYGFMCVVNHGLSQAQVSEKQPRAIIRPQDTDLHQNDRMIDIADVPFAQVSEEEQRAFVSKIRELGEWKGYKPRQFWVRSLYLYRQSIKPDSDVSCVARRQRRP